MPKFLAGCHDNEEEISWHLKKNVGYWTVQIHGNKFATGKILRKPVEVVKGRIIVGWAQKSPEPCCLLFFLLGMLMLIIFWWWSLISVHKGEFTLGSRSNELGVQKPLNMGLNELYFQT